VSVCVLNVVVGSSERDFCERFSANSAFRDCSSDTKTRTDRVSQSRVMDANLASCNYV